MTHKDKITINGMEYKKISFTLKFKEKGDAWDGEWYFEEVEQKDE